MKNVERAYGNCEPEEKRPKSNVERVNEYMTFGSPMNQIFLIESANKYAELVLANQEELTKEMEHGLIHAGAWIQAAKDWQKSQKD